jgi:sodium/hydrogen exchanger-like protein 6/7
MASRYAAVFPLSELINWITQYRGQRYEELPHSYQMMLFWAGLRGAVGVALAAGITGDNADALRTTILVVVVLTVIIFGGTTARMLEVLGIRVGVEDEDASSDEDEGWIARPGNLALQMGPGSRRYAGQNGRGLGGSGYEESELDLHSPAGSPYLAPTMKMPLRNTRPAFGNHASRSGFTNSDEESEDDQPLPSADIDISDPTPGEGGEGMVFRDGQWFTALDERYLLPLFSNSVTARRSMAKKGARKASVYAGEGSQNGTPRGGSLDLAREEEGDLESENGKNKVQRTFRWVSFSFRPLFLLPLTPYHSSSLHVPFVRRIIPFDHDKWEQADWQRLRLRLLLHKTRTRKQFPNR